MNLKQKKELKDFISKIEKNKQNELSPDERNKLKFTSFKKTAIEMAYSLCGTIGIVGSTIAGLYIGHNNDAAMTGLVCGFLFGITVGETVGEVIGGVITQGTSHLLRRNKLK